MSPADQLPVAAVMEEQLLGSSPQVFGTSCPPCGLAGHLGHSEASASVLSGMTDVGPQHTVMLIKGSLT